MHSFRRQLMAHLLLPLLGLLAASPLRAQGTATAAPPIRSLEWIFSKEGRAITRLPSTAWLRDGTALMWDDDIPAAERTLQRLDPATGQRRPAVDAAKALASLHAVAPGLPGSQTLGWPKAIDATGRRVFYLFDNDIFGLDLATATFTRLTHTPAPEKDLGVSPDGEHIAFVRENDLYAVDIATAVEHRLTTDGSETMLNGTLSWVYWEEIFGRKDTAWWWSPDSASIAYLQSDDSPVAVSEFVDFQPAQPRIVRQRYPRAGSANPRVRVGIVSREGGETRWVSIDDKPFEYVLRVQWLPDARRVSVQTLTREQQELGLYFADASTGRATRILTETDPGWINENDDLHFLPRQGQFLWASERDGYMHLYRYTLDGQLVNQVTKGDWAMASADQSAYWVRRAVAGIDDRDEWVYFVSLQQSSLERQLYKVRFDGTGLTRLSREAGTHGISMSPDTRFYLDSFSDLHTLPRLSLRRSDGSLVTALTADRMDRLAAWHLQLPELMSIPASDGFQMPAAIVRPKDMRAGTRYPVILYVYGGPSAPTVHNAWQRYTLYYQLLADAGFVVVEVDNRAATGISKTLENTVLKRSGGPETADLVDAVRWLKRQSWVDPSRVGVFGWSGGGTMTLNLLTRSTEFKAGISIAPVTDWHFYDTKWTESFMKRPDENPQGYADFSLVTRAPNLHGRLLIVFGTGDDNVQPQNEEAFIDALVKAGITFDTAIYPMRKHGISDEPAQVHLFKTMIEFWKAHL